MKKLFIILNAIFAALIVCGDICYTLYGGLWLKGLTSFCFVALGIINLIYLIKNKSQNLKFGIIMVIALFFAMLGDIVLNLHFMAGAIIFAVGHIFYFIAYCFISKFRWLDLLIAGIIFIPSMLIILLVPIFDFGGVMMQIVCVIYALIISCMLGKAISNLLKTRNITNLIIAIGSFLFFFSDLMLLFDVFANVSEVFGILCLATYYPAQILLAHSLFTLKQK